MAGRGAAGTLAPVLLAPVLTRAWPSAYFFTKESPCRRSNNNLMADTDSLSVAASAAYNAYAFVAHDRESLDKLVPLVYGELRAIAHRHLHARGAADTLNSTALVHEAYLKLGKEAGTVCQDRAHFFALASMVMRQILTDRARARVAEKRGGVQTRVTLEEDTLAVEEQAESLLQLDDALGRLAEVAPRLVRVVEFRFFGGMSEDEIASVLGVTSRTVRRDWDKARLLLRRALAL